MLAGCSVFRDRPKTIGGSLRKRQKTGPLIIGEQRFLHVVGRGGKVGNSIIPDDTGSKITMTCKAGIIAISRPPDALGVLFASQHKNSVSQCVSKLPMIFPPFPWREDAYSATQILLQAGLMRSYLLYRWDRSFS